MSRHARKRTRGPLYYLAMVAVTLLIVFLVLLISVAAATA